MSRVPDTLINGKWHDQVSVSDRGISYGDGLFETIKIVNNEPLLLAEHWSRLSQGCARLGIYGIDQQTLQTESMILSRECERGVLKWIVTRGTGGRGYRATQGASPTRILKRYEWPDYPEAYTTTGVMARICDTRLAINPSLAGLKHLNRLEQVMARREWDDLTYAEGIMLDMQDRVIEGTMTNLFLVRNNTLVTPDLAECGVNGVMRQILLRLAQELGIHTSVQQISRQTLFDVDALFVCNSIIGIWPIRQLADCSYPVDVITRRLIQRLIDGPH